MKKEVCISDAFFLHPKHIGIKYLINKNMMMKTKPIMNAKSPPCGMRVMRGLGIWVLNLYQLTI
jgi:hypothetical protein